MGGVILVAGEGIHQAPPRARIAVDRGAVLDQDVLVFGQIAGVFEKRPVETFTQVVGAPVFLVDVEGDEGLPTDQVAQISVHRFHEIGVESVFGRGAQPQQQAAEGVGWAGEEIDGYLVVITVVVEVDAQAFLVAEPG